MSLKKGRNVFNIKWREAWSTPDFRRKLILGWIIYIGILLYFPHFFASIQKKQGVLVNDFILRALPSVNMSAIIFSGIYITVIFSIFRAAQKPYLFSLYLWATIFISVSRIITITLLPLEPPLGLVPLVDPVLRPFYGPNGITKDLFYSGHTASVFLTYLVLRRKGEKIVALIATFVVGISLLLQHIHYSFDVILAPIFVYLFFFLARKVVIPKSL